MTSSPSIALPELADADLVAHSLAGDRQAYAQIVARYQALVCSLAYSICGSIQQSEDLAQETFLKAWSQLRDLREPAKLRPWLCTIARRAAIRDREKDQRQPTHDALSFDKLPEQPAAEATPSSKTITREEESILWRSLEIIPENYREPMVLFYREHQSVERVAEALELSEGTVRQRLSRGRQMLAAQVARFVEGALGSTAPDASFTQGVMSALPLMAISAKSATFGATAAKTGFGKFIAAGGWLAGPLLGLAGAWYGTKTGIEQARSPRERRFLIRSATICGIGATIFVAGMFAISFAAERWWNSHQPAIIAAMTALSLAYAGLVLTLVLRMNQKLRAIREEDGTLALSVHPVTGQRLDNSFEYRSPWTLFGWPLIHINMGPFANGKRGVAKGWIAIGEVACGAVACGGFAFGIVSLGGLSLGLVSIGGFAVGALACGGFAVGAGAIGGVALGWVAAGGSAAAWHASQGGMAIARDFAVGGSATAAHANDEIARAALEHSRFFSLSRLLMDYGLFIVWLPMVLVVWQAWRMRRKTR